MLEKLPYAIQENTEYTFYLGVSNQMSSSNYYICTVKLGTGSEAFPDPNLGVPSTLPALYEYNQCIEEGKSWETPLTFTVNNLTISEGNLLLPSITINGIDYAVNKQIRWDFERNGYFVNLFIELWVFNSETCLSEFNNRYVSLSLKL
jgi:hypothetical protein